MTNVPSNPESLPQDRPEQLKNGNADIWLSTIGSCLLLGASIWMILIYREFFGFGIWGDSPEHWKWLGGLVGFFAILIRLAIIGMFALPYTICSITGMNMSRRVASKSNVFVAVISWILVLCHAIMLLPLAGLLFGFWPLLSLTN